MARASRDKKPLSQIAIIDQTSIDAILANLPKSAPSTGGEAFPIGGVFIAIVNTDPNILLGYGTWSAFGTGKVLVGYDSNDIDFNEAEKTGGAKTHELSVTEMPAHTHTENAPNSASGGTVRFGIDTNASGNVNSTLITGPTGDGLAHNNLQPYIVVYMWERTA